MLDNQPDQLFRKIEFPSVTDEVVDQILNAIRTDVFTPGEKLPSEPKLADQMGVSRNTLREALNTLIEKGFLFRQRGVGTFVTPQSEFMLNTYLASLAGTSSVITNQNMKPGQTNFSFVREFPTKMVAENLKISARTEVIHISRVRTADGIPVICAEEFFSTEIEGLDHDLSRFAELENWSIYDFFRDSGFSIQSVITQVQAVSADKEIADKLHINEKDPLLLLHENHFSNTYNKPLLFCTNTHNDKIINILVRSN